MARRSGVLLLFACSACTGAPILVSAPMLGSADAAEASSDAPISTGTIDGDWSGRGTQSNDRSWPMRVHIVASPQALSAQVTYPDEGCIGEWTMHEVEQGLWEGEENIRHDPRHKCIATGSVTLRSLQDGTLEWTWEGIDPETGAETSATAVLSRAPATQPERPRGR